MTKDHGPGQRINRAPSRLLARTPARTSGRRSDARTGRRQSLARPTPAPCQPAPNPPRTGPHPQGRPPTNPRRKTLRPAPGPRLPMVALRLEPTNQGPRRRRRQRLFLKITGRTKWLEARLSIEEVAVWLGRHKRSLLRQKRRSELAAQSSGAGRTGTPPTKQ